ncbi:glycerol-3-phosphate cytidylyltransferase [Shewanella sp. HN-41]|nr:glycerol-3-phosphate cytidylyltransferase [Shewanella sp. HN-41]
MFHVGHVNILEKCSQLGSELIVGVSSDALNFKKKNRYPVYDEYSRLKIIKSLKFVNEVFIEESLEQKRHYINYYRANILAMGDDWEGRFDDLRDICEVTYFPRTPSISTTEIIEIARKL